MSFWKLRTLSAGLASAVFLVDLLTPLEGAVAVLYVVPVLLAGRTSRRSDIVAASVGCIALTIAAYLLSHDPTSIASPALRATVSLAAIAITGWLALQNQMATKLLADQARLLDLSHDMIFVRDSRGVISFWNKAAEETYGWTSAEALGKVAHDLLRTAYPCRREAIETAAMDTGRWEGQVVQQTKTGAVLTVDARWALQRDGELIGVMETHTDVTANEVAHASLVRSERRYRRMFDGSRIGIIEVDWTKVRIALEGAPVIENDLVQWLVRNPAFVEYARAQANVTDVNPALQKMVGAANSSDLIASIGNILGDGDRTFLGALTSFARGEQFHEVETEIVSLDGRRIPVLLAITFTPGDDSSVLIFVVDITERRQAQNLLLAAQSDLAHAARVATLGELTASITHEVNQPIAAIVTSGEAALRWLRRDVPNLEEVAASINRTVAEGRRASAVVARIRAFLKKAPAQRDVLHLAEIINEASQLVEREFAKDSIVLSIAADADLPPIIGDRVQLQQVLVNLLINAAQAMADRDGPRNVTIRAERTDGSGVMVAVSDSGPGIRADDLPRLFQPFFTTKQDGMGMGLAICRTTVEGLGGRMAAESGPGRGATIRLTLPAIQEPA